MLTLYLVGLGLGLSVLLLLMLPLIAFHLVFARDGVLLFVDSVRWASIFDGLCAQFAGRHRLQVVRRVNIASLVAELLDLIVELQGSNRLQVGERVVGHAVQVGGLFMGLGRRLLHVGADDE